MVVNRAVEIGVLAGNTGGCQARLKAICYPIKSAILRCCVVNRGVSIIDDAANSITTTHLLPGTVDKHF